MKGSSWGQTVASLHLTGNRSSGKAATLYLPAAAAADAEWRDLIVLLALVAMQQELIRRKRCATSHAAANVSVGVSTAGAAGGSGC